MAASIDNATVRVCSFCRKEASRYTCPRCYSPYCCSQCYRSPRHIECSEHFYQEWVEQHLNVSGNREEDAGRRRDIVQILRRQTEQDLEDVDDDCQSADLHDRFADLNLDKVDDESDIWNRLNDTEREEFKHLVDSGHISHLIPVWKPWWLIKEATIREMGSETEQDWWPQIARSIPRLADLTKASPSPKLKFNVLNSLYVYVHVVRFYNGCHHEFPVEATEFTSRCSDSLSGKDVAWNDAAQAILAARKRIEEQSRVHPLPVVSVDLVRDVLSIVQGPKRNRNSKRYVLAAISDLRLLMARGARRQRGGSGQQLGLVVKKLDFYLSWASERYEDLSSVVVDLDAICAGMVADASEFEAVQRAVAMQPRLGPRIVELS